MQGDDEDTCNVEEEYEVEEVQYNDEDASNVEEKYEAEEVQSNDKMMTTVMICWLYWLTQSLLKMT